MKCTWSNMTAAQLQDWRHRRRSSIKKAAEDLGVSEGPMYRWLSGRGKIPQTIAMLCWALNAIDQLLAEIDYLEKISIGHQPSASGLKGPPVPAGLVRPSAVPRSRLRRFGHQRKIADGI